MARPWMIKLTATVHTAYAALVGAISLYCFWLARTISHSGQQQSKAPATAMVIGGCIVAMVCIAYSASAIGFWRKRRWAWWMSLIVNAAAILLILANTFGGDRDPDNWIAIAILAVPVSCLLLSGIKPYQTH